MTTAASFYVVGGTLAPDAPSYLPRAADAELLDALAAGELCYILNARQMGKSSLCLRTRQALTVRSVRAVFLDLTNAGRLSRCRTNDVKITLRDDRAKPSFGVK